jgi:hypothetical protein
MRLAVAATSLVVGGSIEVGNDDIEKSTKW